MMLRRANLLVLFGLIVGAVFIFGLTAGAQTKAETGEDEVGEAQRKLAELRMGAGAAYEAHGNAVFQLSELDEEIAAANEDLEVAQEDLGEAQGRLEDRASTMYKSGNVGFVDVLVGAENFSEFANRLELWVRLLARERAEFDRVREIRDLLADKKALLEATREQRVEALGEADSQLDRASSLEADAQAYLDSLNAELQAALEADQARQAEEARAAGEKLRAEIAKAEPEAVQTVLQPAPRAVKIEDVPAEAIPAGVVTEVPEAPKAEAPEKTVESKPVAATVPETPQPVEQAPREIKEAPQPAEQAPREIAQDPQPVEQAPREIEEEAPEVDLAAQRQAERQAARAARAAAEQRAAEQAAAELYAAEKAAAAEEARLAAEQATADQEQYATEQAAEAERRAELAAQRAAAEQQAAKQAAAQQAEAERLAAEQAEQQAAGQQYADDQELLAEQQQYGGEQPQQVEKEQYEGGTEAVDPTVGGPSDEQYNEGGSAAAPATGAAPAASASGSAVVAEAASHMGTPYVFSPPGPCSANVAEDCSCHTMLVFQMFGISLPDDPVAQYGMGTPVSGPPQAGDLVFWAEGGAGITHVGIATGNGTTIHASSYAGYVTETPIDAIPGYAGARRLL